VVGWTIVDQGFRERAEARRTCGIRGYAVIFHGRPRATKDIDLLVAHDTENRARLAQALSTFGAPEEDCTELERVAAHAAKA
jgi:hypothetical protein